MTEQDFENNVLPLLRASFSGPNDPGLAQRLQKLKAVFQSVDDPALAVKLYDRFSASNPNDVLAVAFRQRLSTSARQDLLAVLTAVRGPAPKPEPRSQEYKLIDEDARVVRTIAHSDPEYQERYVNHNISNITSDPNANTFEFHTMIVHYDDGRKLELSLDDVPVRASIPGMRLVRLSPHIPPVIDHYVCRGGTIIPMSANNEMMLYNSTAPILVDLRTALEMNIQRRHTLLELAMLTNTMAGLVGANISFLHLAVSSGESGLFVWSQKPPPGGPKKLGGAPPSGPLVLPKQYKQVTARELLMWERRRAPSWKTQ